MAVLGGEAVSYERGTPVGEVRGHGQPRVGGVTSSVGIGVSGSGLWFVVDDLWFMV
jgi:hypothetical protein